jgi:hypothetical protein
MMAQTFRSRNLAGGMLVLADKLSPIPKLKICLLRTIHWLPCTCIGVTRPRTQAFAALPCPGGTRHCQVVTRRMCPQWSRCVAATGAPFEGSQFDANLYRRQLTELKADLRVAVAELQAHERAIVDLVKKGSRLAMEELEDGLKDAVRQIEQMKRNR